jgi:phosphomannomutase
MRLMNTDMVTEYDIRGTSETGLTIEYAWNIGKAMADWLPTAGNIAVIFYPAQRDVAAAIIEGVRLQGRNAIDAGAGDHTVAVRHIQALGLSGAAVVATDESTGVTVIELYRETGARIDGATGLKELAEFIDGGNFVPSAVKGELTVLA